MAQFALDNYNFADALKEFTYVPKDIQDDKQSSLKRYLHGRDHLSTRPYSYNRIYGNSPMYTPPKIAAEPQSMTARRSYSGYVYMAGEHSFDVISRPKSLDHYQFWRSHITSSPWYWTYYGNSGLRHYNSFRPRAYTSRLSTYWSPYY